MDGRTACRGNSMVAVAFALPEGVADTLIGLTHGSRVEPLRWLVFGTNPEELSQLDARWSPHLDLTLIMLVGTTEIFLDAVMTVLDAERLTPRECAWINGAGSPLGNCFEFGCYINARQRDAESIASEYAVCAEDGRSRL